MPGTPQSTISTSITTYNLTTLEKAVYRRVNLERASHRVPALRWNEELAMAARNHAASMAARGFFSHEDPVFGNVKRRLDSLNIRWSRCAENLYAGDVDRLADEAVTNWLLSPDHQKIMLNSLHNETGVGIAFLNPD